MDMHVCLVPQLLAAWFESKKASVSLDPLDGLLLLWMSVCVCVVLQLWTAQPPLAEWIRRGQPAHTPPQRPPGAGRKGRHKGRKQFAKPDCTGEGRRKRTHDLWNSR
eukprot:354583-Chlamydomonas_euryale.AAC.1